VTNSEKQEEEKCFLEQRGAFFVFFERKRGGGRERAGEEAIFIFEEVLHTRLSESRHKLYVTKYHPLKQ
jgi:hypothetical protein